MVHGNPDHNHAQPVADEAAWEPAVQADKGLLLLMLYDKAINCMDEALELMAPHVDVLCSDIKSLRDDFYHDICKPAHVQQVLDSIEKAKHQTENRSFKAYREKEKER